MLDGPIVALRQRGAGPHHREQSAVPGDRPGREDDPVGNVWPPESVSAKASFTGGVRERPGGWGASAPFGHLEFDDAELHIWGAGMDLRVVKGAVKGIKLSAGILASRVSVVWADGSLADVYFAALGRRAIRDALRQRGWPVIER